MKKDKVTCSDDEAEAEAEAQFVSVSNYHLEDEKRVPVSFAALPIQWGSEAEKNSDATKEQVFLHGFADNGLKMIMMQVTAWRFDLSNEKPEISLLLSKGKRWIKLQKPRNSYHYTIRTILITVHLLHRVKKNPKVSAESVWDNLFEDKELSCSPYKVKPSQKDLLDHMHLIGEAAKRDAVLAKSKLLVTVLKEKLGNKKLPDEEVNDLIQPALIVDDIDNGINEANEESKVEDDSSYSVCEICDNGGNVTCCDGPCMRSFHATKEDGRESMCHSLGFTRREVKGIQSFYCKNCKYNQHQCFACGKLGSSGEVKGAEVIKCASATCDHFYHPHCVAKLLPQVVKHVAEELERNTADANSFICPVHYCCICKEVENKTEPELQFAVCRRCPKSYHRKCLPREITFDNTEEDTDKDVMPRAWEGLLPNNRILIYCLNHAIDKKLGTPKRDHIKFPNVKATVPEINATNEKMKPATNERVISNKNNVDLDNSSGKSTAKGSKVTAKLSSGKVGSKKNSEKMIYGSNIAKKPEANGKSSCCLTENKTSVSKKLGMPDSEENQPLWVLMSNGSKRTKPNNQVSNAACKTLSVKPIRELSSSFYRPGSVDLNDRQIDQCNGKPPLLSLLKHKVIAQEQHAHLSSQHEVLEMESCDTEILPADHTVDGNCGDNLMPSHDLLTDDQEDQASVNGGQKRSSHNGFVDQQSQEGQESKMSKSAKRKRTEENNRREQSVVSSAKRQAAKDYVEEQHSREEEKDLTESDTRQRVGHMRYGYAQPSSVSESSYKLNTVERYASSLHELNHVRVPQCGYVDGLLGFAPGPNLEYSRRNSAGWLNE